MKHLKWGETPWDDWSREDLLREVQRLYMVAGALRTVADLSRHGNEGLPFWTHGTGARALEMSKQAALPQDQYNSEDMYRAFFRYAGDLLFHDTETVRVGFGWVVCPECSRMVGAAYQGDGVYASNEGQPCASHGIGKPECTGILRRIEWSDLTPEDTP